MGPTLDFDRDFPILNRLRERGGAYLASNTMGVIPQAAHEAELACVKAQQDQGIEVWDAGGPWMAWLDRYAEVIARYVGAKASQVCPVTNITDGLWRIMSCFNFEAQPVIMTTDLAFTTQLYAGHGFERYGAKVVTVPSTKGRTQVDPDTLIQALRSHRPALLHLSHAGFESAYLHELGPIAQACKESGTVFCLDAAQTGFIRPLSLKESGADVILLQQHKWGCAATGAACIVATDAFIKHHDPALVGWMSHARTFAFEKGPAKFGDNAWRFCGGTPDVPAKARGAIAAELLVDTIGLERIQAQNETLLAQLIEGVEGLGNPDLKAIHQPRRTGFLAVQCRDDAHAQAIEAGLKARHVLIDGRGDRLRIGPHVYNTPQDIDAILRGLKALSKL